MTAAHPAVLGGPPTFPDPVPLSRPGVAAGDQLTAEFRGILASGVLTKGSHLDRLEREISAYLGVEDAVLVSSCTVGLTLVLRCLDLTGEVVLPSFTFMATGHAVWWNGLRPVFADIDPSTATLTAADTAAALGPDAAAVLGVHIFGTPCDADALAAVAARRGVPLVIDAAPAFGAWYGDGSPVGTKGLVEVFSLSPTKPFTTGEGGIVTTNDRSLARAVRVAREYGNAGDFDCALVGLNARMPELSAALGRHNLPHLAGWLEQRRALAARYKDNLADVAGVAFQHVPAGAASTFKDLSIIVDADRYGLDRDALSAALACEGVATRSYFNPPLHRQTAYRDVAPRHLPGTETLARAALTVPLFPGMSPSTVDGVCQAIRGIHDAAEAIRPMRSPAEARL